MWRFSSYRKNSNVQPPASVPPDLAESTPKRIVRGQWSQARTIRPRLIETHAVYVVAPDPADGGGIAELSEAA
jgi:L-alanine-DL-glutamate epimerase-like enolase superfamily enzyme